MNTGSRWQRSRAFTLVELLVVMMIIAVLFTILMPVIGSARQAAARSQAQQEMNDIVSAFRGYFEIYGRYPLQANATDRVYDDSQYKLVIDVLRSGGSASTNDLNTHNPRRMVFLSVNERSLNADGVYVDPWKNRYRVAADWSMDNIVNAGSPHGDITGRTVVAWSYGPPPSSASAADRHVKSWTD